VKIGYAVGLRLLRSGATVIATSRFPHDTARRYAAESDFGQWRERLHIYGLDLRHMGALAEFIQYLYRAYPKLDIVVNNAAQTVRRPPAYYAPLLPFERTPHGELPQALQGVLRGVVTNLLPGAGDAVLPLSAELSQVSLVPGEGDTGYFPAGKLDRHAQPLDLRPHTSWTYRLEELSIPEIVEVQLINATAPAVLAGQLKELLTADRAENDAPKYIINVAAAEGQFAKGKNGAHPHTNMAKAALNMLTYTSAADYAESGLYMLSVDPGWVSEQRPYILVQQPDAAEDTPLDLEDAAARICDPLFHGSRVAGVLLKDFKVANW
jgi:NAD(P)-dependent dehydrogenase (short-subunit alcohol dehydrogenase family)